MPQMTLFTLPELPANKGKTKDAVNKVNKSSKKSSSTTTAGGRGIDAKIKVIAETSKKYFDEDEAILINNEIAFREYMRKARQLGILAFDTETEGLDVLTDKIAGICIYTPYSPEAKPAYVPINHVSHVTGALLPNQVAESVIIEELNNLEGVQIVLQNAKFDVRVCRWQLGKEYKTVNIIPYWDTMIGGFLLNENEPHGLKYLHTKYVKKTSTDDLATFEKIFQDVKFTMIPPEIGCAYAARDAKMTYELFKFQEQFLDGNSSFCRSKNLTKMAKLFREIEMPLIPVIADMEDNGISIDGEYAKSLTTKYTAMLDKLEIDTQRMIDFYGDKIDKLPMNLRSKIDYPFNISSPTQLAILFYDVLKLESPDKTKPRGTGEEILKAFGLPICDKILEYRGVKKLLTTYIDKLPAVASSRTGKIHASFNQYGAATGRFSSSDPNLQNIPSKNKDIRKMFVADKGQVLISSDFSQQEPRLLAHMSGDEHLVKAYMDGKDIYATIASRVYKVAYEECLEFRADGSKNDAGKKRRNNTKSIVLGIMYGRGANSIAEQTGMSKEEAQSVIDEFFGAFPKIKVFVESSVNHAKQFGFVETVYGRKRRLPDIQLPEVSVTLLDGSPVDAGQVNGIVYQYKNAYGNKKKKEIRDKYLAQGIKLKDNGGFIAQAERQCVNSMIQGGGADISKKAMVILGNSEELKALNFKILLTVHDEIIGMCPEEHRKECASLMSRLMISSCKDEVSVPMKCDTETTRCWYGDEVE